MMSTVIMMVMMVAVIPSIPWHDHDRTIMATIEAVMVMVVVVVVIELRDLHLFGCRWRRRFIDGLQQGAGVGNRLQQVGV